MKWYEGRPVEIRVRAVQLISCAVMFVYGFGLSVWPGDYSSPAYTPAFDLMRAALWGTTFMVVGVLGVGALVGPRPAGRGAAAVDAFGQFCQFARVSLMMFWTVLLFIGVAQYNPGTRLGPVVWLAPALMDLASVMRVGTGRGS